MANFLCDFLPEHLCDDQIEVYKDRFVEKSLRSYDFRAKNTKR